MTRMRIDVQLVASVILVIAGMQVFIIQPGLIAVVDQKLALGEVQDGYLAAAELAGIATSTIAAAILGPRLRWRSAIVGSVLVIAGADAASAQIVEPLLFSAVRFLAGLGSGMLISIGYALAGMSGSPDRSFGYVIAGLLAYGALGLLALPSLAQSVGLVGIFATLAALALLPLTILRVVPVGAPHPNADIESSDASNSAHWRQEVVALSAVLAFFLGQGFIWPYLAVLGTTSGLSDQVVAQGLAVSQLVGLVGALSLGFLGQRFKPGKLVAAGSLCSILSLAAMMGTPSELRYALAVSAFNGAANLLTPLVMAISATVSAGQPRTVQRAAALQMIGLAVGPAIAGYTVGQTGFAGVIGCAALLFAIPWILLRAV